MCSCGVKHNKPPRLVWSSKFQQREARKDRGVRLVCQSHYRLLLGLHAIKTNIQGVCSAAGSVVLAAPVGNHSNVTNAHMAEDLRTFYAVASGCTPGRRQHRQRRKSSASPFPRQSTNMSYVSSLPRSTLSLPLPLSEQKM